jgi:hypothetical protein
MITVKDSQDKKRTKEFNDAVGVLFTGGPEFLGQVGIVAGLILFGISALVVLATGGIAYLVYMLFFAKDERIWEKGVLAGCRRLVYLWARGIVRATFTLLDCCTFGFTRWYFTRWLKLKKAKREGERLKVPHVHV